jgi:hypothetical protein
MIKNLNHLVWWLKISGQKFSVAKTNLTINISWLKINGWLWFDGWNQLMHPNWHWCDNWCKMGVSHQFWQPCWVKKDERDDDDNVKAIGSLYLGKTSK